MNSGSRRIRNSLSLAMVIVAALLALMWGAPGSALAVAADPGCAALGGNDAGLGTECQITTFVTATGTFTLGESLHVFGTGRIDATTGGITLNICTSPTACDLILDSPTVAGGGQIEANDPLTPPGPTGASASPITINVSRDVIMHANSAILAKNTSDGGGGGDIAITAGRNMTMNAGATIDSTGSGSSGNSPGGDITIAVGTTPPATPAVGVFTMDTGSQILANGISGSAGEIKITAGLQMDVDGLVQSKSTITGTGAVQPRGGGPISLVSGCKLTVSDTGTVSSEGADPGADLVHLEGCEVVVDGIVQSIADTNGGHALPNAPPNHCNNDTTAHPFPFTGAAFTACVEIWGNNISIDATGSHNGRVDVDGIRTDGPPRRGWIDIFARENVTIVADTAGNYAVSANAAGGTNQFGGLITVKAKNGQVVTKALVPGTEGLAIQANATGAGSRGGDVVVQAGGLAPNGKVDFTSDSIQAMGGAIGGGSGSGGTISARSFNDSVLGSSPGELNAGAGTGAPVGVVSLTACLLDPAVTYAGTVTGTEVDAGPGAAFCGGTPTFPSAVEDFFASRATFCDADCVLCIKSGTKFNDLNGINGRDPGEPGIQGVQIHLFDKATLGATVHEHQVTDASGNYSFSVPVLPGAATGTCGEFIVCEQGGPPTQTFPATDGSGGLCAAHVGLAASNGYDVTLVLGVPDTGNDFGNRVAFPPCPEDPKAILTRLVNPSLPLGGSPPNYHSVQAAYNDAAAGEVIGMFGNFVENVSLDKGKSLTITQCTSAKVTAADNTLPVWSITGGPVTIIGPDSVGGTIGWFVGSDGNTLKAVRASNASQFGILVTGNNNTVSVNSVSGSPVGIRVEGDNNTLKPGGSVSGNGDGVQIGASGTGNTVSIGNVLSNSGNGMVVDGASNTVSSNGRVDSNGKNGILVNGNNNTIKNNAAGSGAGKGNAKDGIQVVGTGNTLDSNKTSANGGNGINVTATATGTKLKSNQSNNGSSGSSTENVGAEFLLGVAAVNQGGNKADGISIPKTTAPVKCPTFPAAGTCE
jgi:parallel beta helix pectate lyase-like protein